VDGCPSYCRVLQTRNLVGGIPNRMVAQRVSRFVARRWRASHRPVCIFSSVVVWLPQRLTARFERHDSIRRRMFRVGGGNSGVFLYRFPLPVGSHRGFAGEFSEKR